jgi:CelD/BcsL family acetyltransferase involved in cellulose biosynthesis
VATNISDMLVPGIAAGAPEVQSRRDASCEVAVFEGADAIEHAASAWQAIEDAGGVNSPFQSLAVARAAAPAHIANGEMPRIVTVRDGKRPMAVFPTVVGHWLGIPSIRFLGEPFVQYGDVIARPDAKATHLHAALAAAADERVASVAFFRRVRIDAVIAPILAHRAAVVTDDGAPIVDLQDGAKLKSHHARELRRLRRRLSEQGDLVFEVVRGAATREILHETLQFKRDWLIERGLPSALFGNRHWERVILDLAGARCGATEMMVARVLVGGMTAATEIGFVDRDTWFAYMGALSPDIARFGPGHILMDELMAWCRARGLKAYDLLPPIQPYKLALASRAIPARDYALALGLAGFAAILAARAVPTGKRMAAAAPLSWRRWIVRRHLGAAAPLDGISQSPPGA